MRTCRSQSPAMRVVSRSDKLRYPSSGKCTPIALSSSTTSAPVGRSRNMISRGGAYSFHAGATGRGYVVWRIAVGGAGVRVPGVGGFAVDGARGRVGREMCDGFLAGVSVFAGSSGAGVEA